MTWKNIGIFQVTTDWQITELTGGTIYRISHQATGNTQNLIGLIAQAFPDPVTPFEKYRMAYRPGKDGFIFSKPPGVEWRGLAVRRADTENIAWTVTIEELEDVSSVNFPLPLSAIDGLEIAIDGKAPAVHNHLIAEVSGLQNAINNLNISLIQTTVPSSPVIGLEWREVNSSRRLAGIWYWNSGWFSEIKEQPFILPSNNDLYAGILLDPTYDYWIKTLSYHLVSSTALTSTNYAEITFAEFTNNSATADLMTKRTHNSLSVNGSIKVQVPVEALTTSNGNNSLQVRNNRVGSASYLVRGSIFYQLKRK